METKYVDYIKFNLKGALGTNFTDVSGTFDVHFKDKSYIKKCRIKLTEQGFDVELGKRAVLLDQDMKDEILEFYIYEFSNLFREMYKKLDFVYQK